jgi:acetyl esterase
VTAPSWGPGGDALADRRPADHDDGSVSRPEGEVMAVKPEVKSFLDLLEQMGAPPMAEQTPVEVRAAFGALSALGVKEEMASVTDRTIPGPGGDLPVRIYVPTEPMGGGDPPVLVWFHGGGWVIGDIESADTTVRALAAAAGMVAVSVDYRLAPEHAFPAAVDDALAAVRWVVDNAASLGVDPARLVVGGDSAGGNLAAVVAQQLRDSGPAMAFQLLVYPVTDARLSTGSMDENAEGYFLTKDTMFWFREHYLGSQSFEDVRVSPLLAPDDALTGLPPALVITAEYDPLRDEGEAYGERLRGAGVETTVTRYDGVIHGFFSLRDVVPDGGAAINEAATALRKALG